MVYLQRCLFVMWLVPRETAAVSLVKFVETHDMMVMFLETHGMMVMFWETHGMMVMFVETHGMTVMFVKTHGMTRSLLFAVSCDGRWPREWA